MEYGICCNPQTAQQAARTGFDYFEWTVGAFLKPREDAQAFQASLNEVRQSGLPCPAVNVFVPADLKITGPSVNQAALEEFVTTACLRASQAGVDRIVFGSGGARRVPEGFDRREAWNQLLSFLHMLAPIASRNGITIAVEPLNLAECNILTSVAECARLVRQVNHPSIRLLVDAYHLLKDNDSLEDIVANRDLLAHVHVATVPNRLAPGMEDCGLPLFFEALKLSGYTGRISIEANLPDSPHDFVRAIQTMSVFF